MSHAKNPAVRPNPMPQHVAIIMDGNGRWASSRFLPRIAGHKRGLDAVRKAVTYATKHEIPYLTIFAFSSENWRRPPSEVSFLMSLFERALANELARLSAENIRLNIIGDISRFSEKLQAAITSAIEKTANNERLVLTIAVNYGGRWDITQAISRLLADKSIDSSNLTEESIRPYLSLGHLPDPDLFIRTGGERRISNFMLWHLAYTELYFTDILWPDFTESYFDEAIDFYRHRERRFGQTSEQVSSSC